MALFGANPIHPASPDSHMGDPGRNASPQRAQGQTGFSGPGEGSQPAQVALTDPGRDLGINRRHSLQHRRRHPGPQPASRGSEPPPGDDDSPPPARQPMGKPATHIDHHHRPHLGGSGKQGKTQPGQPPPGRALQPHDLPRRQLKLARSNLPVKSGAIELTRASARGREETAIAASVMSTPPDQGGVSLSNICSTRKKVHRLFCRAFPSESAFRLGPGPGRHCWPANRSPAPPPPHSAATP